MQTLLVLVVTLILFIFNTSITEMVGDRTRTRSYEYIIFNASSDTSMNVNEPGRVLSIQSHVVSGYVGELPVNI